MANIYNGAVYSAAGELNPAKNKNLDLCRKCLAKPHTSLGEVLKWEAAQVHTNICLQQLLVTLRGLVCNLRFPSWRACHFSLRVYSILVERLKNLQDSDLRSAEVSKVKNNADVSKVGSKENKLFPCLERSAQKAIAVTWKYRCEVLWALQYKWM